MLACGLCGDGQPEAAAGLFMVARLPSSSAEDLSRLSAGQKFVPLSISLPNGAKHQEIRQVNQDYKHIDAWISSVGAAIARAGVPHFVTATVTISPGAASRVSPRGT